jgi:hypothetical protein
VLATARTAEAMLVTVDDLDGGVGTLRSAGFNATRDNGHLRVTASRSRAANISETLACQGHWVTDMRPEEQSLEDLFLELTDGATA